ncbi:MAG: hypothetical protein E6767_20635 [Dysgonomonas sp.]|nr:hypothetical protein [Dysgonomonas sp.]
MEYLNSKLKGEQLSSVEFVQDYLHSYGDIEYRNQLCNIISKKVIDLYIKENEILKLFFDDNKCLELNLDPSNPNIIAEIGFFEDPSDNSWIAFE